MFRDWWAAVRQQRIPLRDDEGRYEAAFRRLPDEELRDMLEELDREPMALWDLYSPRLLLTLNVTNPARLGPSAESK
jgi:hypothetical protein